MMFDSVSLTEVSHVRFRATKPAWGAMIDKGGDGTPPWTNAAERGRIENLQICLIVTGCRSQKDQPMPTATIDL